MHCDFVRKRINQNAFFILSLIDGILVFLELLVYSVFIYKITMSGFSLKAKKEIDFIENFGGLRKKGFFIY